MLQWLTLSHAFYLSDSPSPRMHVILPNIDTPRHREGAAVEVVAMVPPPPPRGRNRIWVS